jgi:5-(carboxyamino)imidazole ribonucleotide synthase
MTGAGQAVLRRMDEAEAAFDRLRPHPLVLEAHIPLRRRAVRHRRPRLDGATVTYDAVENRHRHHILDLSFAPARLPAPVAGQARRHAGAMAEALGLVGVAALELFLLPDGTLLGNEIAPRPHNSGHWTMDACRCSQFEQHIRAVAGLPLGPTDRHADAVMRNLVGPEGLEAWPDTVAAADSVAHWYGKSEARPGRKLGHATRLLPLGSLADVAETELFPALGGPVAWPSRTGLCLRRPQACGKSLTGWYNPPDDGVRVSHAARFSARRVRRAATERTSLD